MTIHPALFAAGVLLLSYPADRLLSARVQLRGFDFFRSLDRTPRRRPWWWVPLLWLDPIRGAAGTFLLRAAVIAPTHDWALTEKIPYAVVVAVIAAGVACQMFTRREPDTVLAPIGFVAGVVMALTPWPVALIGLTMGVTGMLGFRSFPAFFAVGLLAVATLGFALEAGPVWLIPALVVLALPGAVGALSGRTLEIPTRDDAGAHATARPRD